MSLIGMFLNLYEANDIREPFTFIYLKSDNIPVSALVVISIDIAF